jgi:hypothetical protein
MNTQMNNFVESYTNWLKTNIHQKEINGYYEITTPFLDRHNDHLQIYVKQNGDQYILTDDGYILSDLILSGCDIHSPNRQNILETILNSLGVKNEGDSLIIEARQENFPQKKHLLLQAMISVNDMFMTSQPRVVSLFLEDVEHFLELQEVRFTSAIQFTGKSGFIHNFDFVIPASKKKNERIIKAVNILSRERAQQILFAWNDIHGTRKHDTNLFVFTNDTEQAVRAEISGALKEYAVVTIPWSKREDYLEELVA